MDQQPSEQQPKSTIRTIRLVRSTPIQSLESQPVVSASEPTSDPTESPKSTSIVVNTLLQNSGELISSPYVLDYIRLTPSQQVDLERMVKNVQTEFSETLNWAVTKYNANSPEYKASLKDTIEALETSTHNPVAVAIALQRYFESSKEAQEGTVETKNNWKSRWNNITDSISEYAGRIVMSGLLATALFATPAIMRSCEISNEKDRIEAAKQAVIDKVSAEKQAVIDKANAQEREAKAEKEKKETLESRLQKQTLISTTYSSLTTNTTMNPVALKEAYQKVLQDDMIFRIEENQIKGYEVSNGNNVTYVINEDTINKSVMNFCAKLELKGIKYDDGLKIVNALVKASEKSNPTDILEAAGKIADKISEKNITIDKTINSIELVAGDNSPYKTAKYAIMNYISNYPEKNSPVETTTASQPVADTTPKISTYQQILNDTNQTESVRKLLVRRAMIDEVKRYEAT